MRTTRARSALLLSVLSTTACAVAPSSTEDATSGSEALSAVGIGVIQQPIVVPTITVDSFSPAGPQAFANAQVNVTLSEIGVATSGIIEGDVDGHTLGGATAVTVAGGQSVHVPLTAYGYSLNAGAHVVTVRYKVQSGQVFTPSGHFQPIYTVLATATKELAIGPYVGWPRFDQVYRTSTHNAYWVKRDNVPELEASGTQERILDQLLFDHTRALEIDVHKDDPTPGNWTVYHTDKESNSLCSPLRECLKQLQMFHYLLPQHEAVVLHLELKEIVEDNFDSTHTPAQLDALLESYLGPWLFRPRDQLLRGGNDLRDSVARFAWPTTAELRGKFLVNVIGNWHEDITWDVCDTIQSVPVLPSLFGCGAHDKKSVNDWWLGHGGEGWVSYANYGRGMWDRTAFPLQSNFERFNRDPTDEQVDWTALANTYSASVFVQEEAISAGSPPPTSDVTPIPSFVAAHGIVRADDGQASFADQQTWAAQGLQLHQTDTPWFIYDDRGPKQPTHALPGVTLTDPSQLFEPGHRVMLTAANDRASRAFAYTTIAGATGDWQTLPSTTKASPIASNPNPHRGRGKGCLRAQTALGEAVSVCRQTQEGAWNVQKPLQEDIAITVEVARNGGEQTLVTSYSDAHTSAGAGDMIRLVVNGACATAFTASEMDSSGNPAWKGVGDAVCVSGALTLQGVTAEHGDVLFVGTKNGASYVSGSGLTFGGGDFTLDDESYVPPLVAVATHIAP